MASARCFVSRALALLAAALVLQTGSSSAAAEDAPACDASAGAEAAFLAWFAEKGGDARGVTLGSFDGLGRGVKATADVAEGAMVLQVPFEAVITRRTLAALGGGAKALMVDIDRAKDSVLLASFVLLERAKGEASAWAPYLDVLPERVDAAWLLPDDAVRELHDPLLEQDIAEQRAANAADYQLFVDAIQRAAKLDAITLPETSTSRDAFSWALSVVDSRALTIQGSKYLVPFVDMFNYAPHPLPRKSAAGDFFLKHHVLTSSSIQVFADRKTAAGGQLMMDYGDNPNQIYFMHHGFVAEGNPFDCFFISATLASEEDDKLAHARAELLSRLRVPAKPRDCIRWNTAATQWTRSATFMVERVKLMTEEQVFGCLKGMKKAKTAAKYDMAVKVCLKEPQNPPDGSLEGKIRELLEAIATTPAADRAAAAEAVDPALRLALQYRATRKMLMAETLEHLETGSFPPSPHGVPPLEQAVAEITALGAFPEADLRASLDRPLAEKVEALNAWVAEFGFPVQRIRAAEVPGLRVGTLANEPLDAEQPYLVVPPDAVMDTRSAARSKLYPVLYHLGENLGRPDAFHELLLLLLFEYFVMGPRSFWWPYLALLPRGEEVMSPVYFSDDELAELQGHWVADEITANAKNMHKRFAPTSEFLFRSLGEGFLPRSVLTEENYVWAHVILDSRGIWWEGERHLVPLLDMVNCRGGGARPHRTYVDPALGGAVTKTAQAYAADEQVFEDYGQPNHIYFMHHGFSLEHNPSDCIKILVELNQRQRMAYAGFKLGNPRHPDARSRVHFCVSSPLSGNADIAATFKDNMEPVRSALEAVASRLQIPLAEDEARLPTLSPKASSALRFVMGEKRLLQRLVAELAEVSA